MIGRLVVVAILTGTIGCSSDTEETHAHSHTDVVASAATCSEDVDTYAIGLARATEGGTWTVTMMGATPSTPDVGLNQFKVKVTNANDEPVEGVTVTVEPRMPLHGHGTSPATFGAMTAANGQTSLPVDPDDQAIDLIMPGAWTLSFHVEDSAGTKETATFSFCLEG